MKRTILLLALLALAVPAAAEDDGIHTRTLANGLRIVVKEDHSKPLAALRVYVRTGKVSEMEFLGCGISHYYEHLLSGGTTKNLPEEESAKILMELGGQDNAYTSSEHTCYHIVTHRDFLDRAVHLYGEWMRNNVLDPAEVEREKGVILKEINMGEDEPDRVLYQLFIETMYREHPIRVPTIGYRQNFERITRDDLVQYYKNHYAPNNSIVAVAGDVDPEAVFAMVEKHLGAWERRPVPVIHLTPEPRQTAARYAEKEMDVKQAHVRMGFHTIDLFHADLYALDMVSAVLSQGRSSRLHRRIVEEERLTDGIRTYSYTPWFMSGTFGVNFQAPVEKIDRIFTVLREEFERIKSGPVTEEELARAKVLVVSEYRLGRQSVQDQATAVGRDVMSTGNPRFSQGYLERIQSVTPEQVVSAAKKYLDPDQLTTAVLKPRGSTGSAVAEGPEAGGAQELAQTELPNGLRLLVKRIPGVGPVAVETFMHGGLRAEPEGKNGVSFLTGRLLVKGTTSRTGLEIAEQVEGIGAGIGAASGNNTIGVSVTLGRGAEDLPFAAELLADVLGNATFPEEEFAKEKGIAAMLIARKDANWQAEIIDFTRRELFAGGAYANPTVGTHDTLAGITRDDVLAFAKRWIRPEGMVVVVAGDVDPKATLALFTDKLGGLERGEGYAPPAPKLPAWAETGALPEDRFVFKQNEKNQAVLCISFPGAAYGDIEDRAALAIMDGFTSGIGLPSGWFHTALRGGEELLVYFIHLSLFSGLEPGMVYVYTQTREDLLKTVYSKIIEQVERLRAGKFTDEELEIGRSMALVAEPYYAQTVNNVAQSIGLGVLYGGGADQQEKFQAALMKVTREDVMQAVGKFIRKMQVAVTGPASVRKAFEALRD